MFYILISNRYGIMSKTCYTEEDLIDVLLNVSNWEDVPSLVMYFNNEWEFLEMKNSLISNENT